MEKRRQVALFQTPARRSACALLPQQRIRRVLVDHAFRRHHGSGEKLGNIFFLSTNFDWRSGRGAAHFPRQPLSLWILPNHDDQRKTVQGAVAPQNLKELEATIRSRAAQILDELPLGETFNWVDRVSIELTTQMLATLFDFPFEDRSKLTRWSDIVFARLGEGIIESHEQRQEELMECLAYFTRLWKEREDNPVGNDFISMMIRGDATRDLSPQEYLGNILLLIVGGNDTTRNSISGGVLALNQHPQEYQKLRDNPAVIPNMVSEIIRWVTPLAHMRRTVTKGL